MHGSGGGRRRGENSPENYSRGKERRSVWLRESIGELAGCGGGWWSFREEGSRGRKTIVRFRKIKEENKKGIARHGLTQQKVRKTNDLSRFREPLILPPILFFRKKSQECGKVR